MRIGHGFDIHRLAPDRRLVLGGVHIPFELGLLGHSDADALVHAIMDALLGACGKKDIGQYFPDTHNDYKDADSMGLLKEVMKIIAPFEVVNIDCTILAEKPKLGKYIPDMIARIEEVVGMGKINIKATTMEKLGDIGESRAIACEAVCLVE